MASNPSWYKDAIIYQLHVRSFADSDDDGVGDFQGLTEKLDYLQDLGVTALWLLPFYPSPMKDEGYDITDYTGVHPMYGNLQDFQTFLEEAHQRDLRVIIELVLNHTSDQHPWFQWSRRAAPGSPWRNFYVWSENPERYKEAQIIFKDYEFSNWAWDPVAKAYYWHRFYSHQPDLNFDNPSVQREIFSISDFWLGMGVDGLRLDSVPYLFEREGTNCENLPETHLFLQMFRQHIETNFKDRMLLAEANLWPEDAVAYFGAGDECQMAFHFPLMPRMFIALRMEDHFPIVETLNNTPKIPDSCQWALFLRNHDELTLDMVTAEERSFIYRAYARNPRARINLEIRRRLAPILQNDRKQIELLNGLLFSLPGTPVIYYGDEIGMGDNIYLGDRNGVRTPMQWSHDRNAGFSRANPQQIYLPVTTDPEYHYEIVNVEAQSENPYSLLRWMKQLIAIRKRYRAFSQGKIELLYPENPKVLAFMRSHEAEKLLVVANLSRFIQYVELNLAQFEGMRPIELFGNTPFPPIGELPYFLTLGPHTFYWFALENPQNSALAPSKLWNGQIPTLTLTTDWKTIFTSSRAKTLLENILPNYLKRRRWFQGKNRNIQGAKILESIPIPHEVAKGYLTLIEVEYNEGDQEIYVLPFVFLQGEQATRLEQDWPQLVAAHLRFENTREVGILCDGLRQKDLTLLLLEAIGQHRSFRGIAGELKASPLRASRFLLDLQNHSWQVKVAKVENAIAPEFGPPLATADLSNTTVNYNERFALKLFRRIEPGINPDLEIGRFLTEKVSLARAPQVLGAIEYHQKNCEPATIAILRTFIPHKEDAWQYTQAALDHYFERLLAHLGDIETLPFPPPLLPNFASPEIPALVGDLLGDYLPAAKLLGQRTAELHSALAQEMDDPHFAPEPFTDLLQRPFYHAMLGLIDRNFSLLRQQKNQLPAAIQEIAEKVLAAEQQIRTCFLPFRNRKITAMRIRCHGNYHLPQVLRSNEDFIITDFEGEPTRSLAERCLKASPLRDIANMLRSFHYAAFVALFRQEQRYSNLFEQEKVSKSLKTAGVNFWYKWITTLFLQSYQETALQAPLLLQTPDEFYILLDVYSLEKAFYELGYELNQRPEWVKIPLLGILQILEAKVHLR